VEKPLGRKGLEGFSPAVGGTGARKRGAPQSPVFCGKEAPLYGALKSKKCAKMTEKSKYNHPELPRRVYTFSFFGLIVGTT
jgi:hypothetical protein